MFAALFQRRQTPGRGTSPSSERRAPVHLTAAKRASMTTAWVDFGTGEKGIIHMCQGHADGFVDDVNTWRPTVTCPFHSVPTLPLPKSPLQNDNAPPQHQEDQAMPAMATSTLFPVNQAASFLPLRQQIIANATVLFPLVARPKHKFLFRRGHASPNTLFQIAILATCTSSKAHHAIEGSDSTRYQALLTHGQVTKQRTAAVGGVSTSIVSAMESLLSALCFQLGERRDEVVETIPEGRRARCLGGYADEGLVRKVAVNGRGKGEKA